MFGIGRGGQPKALMRGWAKVGESALRVDRTEYILALLLVASVLMSLALVLGWRPPPLPGY
jgi:hypothetical protein